MEQAVQANWILSPAPLQFENFHNHHLNMLHFMLEQHWSTTDLSGMLFLPIRKRKIKIL